jgi:hypothetical protein
MRETLVQLRREFVTAGAMLAAIMVGAFVVYHLIGILSPL